MLRTRERGRNKHRDPVDRSSQHSAQPSIVDIPELLPVAAGTEQLGQRLRRAGRYFALQRTPSAIKALDGLRGIAILLVLARHGMRPFRSTHDSVFPVGSWDAAIPFTNGWMGVDLFFVLSGFLISHHILRRWTAGFRWTDIKSYLVKRFLRIAPAYYVVLLIVSAGWIPFYAVSADGLARRVAYHIVFLQDYLGADIVVPFWSLGVEEKFYMLVPFLLIPLMRLQSLSRTLRVLGFLCLFPLVFRAVGFASHPDLNTYERCFWVLRSPFHFCCDALMVGAMTAFIYHHRARCPRLFQNARVSKTLFWCGTIVVTILLFRAPLLDSIEWFDVTALFPLLAVGFGAVLLSLVANPDLYGRVFQSNTLFFFSKISYSLYLVHMLFVAGTMDLLNSTIALRSMPVAQQFLIFFPVYCVFSILAALALHYTVEKPFLILKDRVGRSPTAQSVTGRG